MATVELLSKKDRKAQANEIKRCQDALDNFVKRNPNFANDPEQAKQHAKLVARVSEVSQLAAGARPLDLQDRIAFFTVAFLVALLPACMISL